MKVSHAAGPVPLPEDKAVTLEASGQIRIAFVDARNKTKLFREIAERLDQRVFWLIQDHSSLDRETPNAYFLPYPKRRDLNNRRVPVDPTADRILRRVESSDRVKNVFGRSTRHYAWYYGLITDWLDDVKPDVLFGEAGSFHSHMTALLAEERGIPFLNPLSSRYPPGRFAFFRSDRIVPVGGSGEVLSTEELSVLVRRINEGSLAPDYMAVKRPVISKVTGRLRAGIEWVRGEKYTSQAPWRFLHNRMHRQQMISKWEALSVPLPPANDAHLRVLYPLQVQPEMNLDVWGFKHRDQAALVEQLARWAHQQGAELWVKPNPKSSFELSEALIRILESTRGVKALSHSVRMNEIVDDMNLVVTVSGSIAIERLLKQAPVLILNRDYSDWVAGKEFYQDEPLTQLTVTDLLDVADYPSPNDVASRLLHTSFPGVISEPMMMPEVLGEKNITHITSAFRRIIKRCTEPQAGPLT